MFSNFIAPAAAMMSGAFGGGQGHVGGGGVQPMQVTDYSKMMKDAIRLRRNRTPGDLPPPPQQQAAPASIGAVTKSLDKQKWMGR